MHIYDPYLDKLVELSPADATRMKLQMATLPSFEQFQEIIQSWKFDVDARLEQEPPITDGADHLHTLGQATEWRTLLQNLLEHMDARGFAFGIHMVKPVGVEVLYESDPIRMIAMVTLKPGTSDPEAVVRFDAIMVGRFPVAAPPAGVYTGPTH